MRLASEVQYNYALLVVKATFTPQKDDRSDLKASFDSVMSTAIDCLQSTPGIEVLENGGEHAMPRSTVGIDQSNQSKDPLWLYQRHSTVNRSTIGDSTHRVKTAPLLRGGLGHPAPHASSPTGEGSSFNSTWSSSLSTAEAMERPSSSSSEDNGESSEEEEEESESEDKANSVAEEGEELEVKGGPVPAQLTSEGLDGVDLLTATVDDAYGADYLTKADGAGDAGDELTADQAAGGAGKASPKAEKRPTATNTKKSKINKQKKSPRSKGQEEDPEVLELWAPTAVLSGSQVASFSSVFFPFSLLFQ